MINEIKFPERDEWPELIRRPVHDYEKIKEIINPIIGKVKEKGDKALRKFVFEYDHVRLDDLLVTPEEIQKSKNRLGRDLKNAIYKAKINIQKFHEAQKPGEIRMITSQGVTCIRKAVPVEKVGLYIPGGTAPLFSTVLMLGIPAKIAGCDKIVMCTPCNIDGEVNPNILYSADLIGIDTIVKVGGAQAIAAMAYGTETVPKVNKIFGPGNQYVTMAKQLVSQEGVAIDMPAGPSELAILADTSANPAYMASDLLSQAEHGIDSQVILVTTSINILREIKHEILKQLKTLSRKHIIEKSLDHCLFIQVHSTEEGIDFINEYAPEHLILSVYNPEKAAEKIKNAGSVFLGNFSPEAAGDYASGTNHTLPTNGFARSFSGVSTESFMKYITFQNLTREGLGKLGKAIEAMAEAEELQAHKNAISIRLKDIQND